MSKRAYLILLPALLLSLMLSLVPGCAKTPPPEEEEAAVVKVAPTVIITPDVAKIDSKLQMVITGSGFEPGQEILILVGAPGVAPAILSAAEQLPGKAVEAGPLDVKPVPDETGAWITVWTLKSYIKMLGSVAENKGEGLYTVQVVDADYNVLASAPFALADTTKPKEQWPAWAQVLLK